MCMCSCAKYVGVYPLLRPIERGHVSPLQEECCREQPESQWDSAATLQTRSLPTQRQSSASRIQHISDKAFSRPGSSHSLPPPPPPPPPTRTLQRHWRGPTRVTSLLGRNVERGNSGRQLACFQLTSSSSCREYRYRRVMRSNGNLPKKPWLVS